MDGQYDVTLLKKKNSTKPNGKMVTIKEDVPIYYYCYLSTTTAIFYYCYLSTTTTSIYYYCYLSTTTAISAHHFTRFTHAHFSTQLYTLH